MAERVLGTGAAHAGEVQTELKVHAPSVEVQMPLGETPASAPNPPQLDAPSVAPTAEPSPASEIAAPVETVQANDSDVPAGRKVVVETPEQLHG